MYGYALQSYIVADARARGLDPAAVLSVAEVEGGFAEGYGHYDPDTQGAPGWSYGPFQLRSPGALPFASRGASGPGAAWSTSQAGIDYALDAIAKVARGLRDGAAIDAIVRGFEHPADPAAEIARAQALYPAFAAEPLVTAGGTFTNAASGSSGNTPAAPASPATPTKPPCPTWCLGESHVFGIPLPGCSGCATTVVSAAIDTATGQPIGSAPGGSAGQVVGILGLVGNTFDLLGRVFGFLFSIRGLELLGGLALIGFGLLALLRRQGVSVPSLPLPGRA